MPREKPPVSNKREKAELAELAERVLSEAPAKGANPLLAEGDEVEEAGKVVYGKRKRFSELPISKRTLDGLAGGKFERMTDIQRAAIPHALAGRDVLGAAKTGSGKTLAFLVPVLELLHRLRWSSMDGLGAVVISPTRELAMQIFDVLRVVGKQHELSAGLVIGGKDKAEEAERITRMNLLVCTPGRLLQHFDETVGFDASNMQVLVIDEADRILDLGFEVSLSAIVAGMPKQRQTLLFSATQTRSIKALARLSLKDPQYVAVHEHSATATPARLRHHYMVVEAEQKLEMLWSFVKSHLQEKTIVFCSSCKQVQYIHGVFSALRPGASLLCLHGRQKQMKRLATYTQFCQKAHVVLFATDVAARGLDFPQVGWVVQADCPEDVATYIHRTGRTARYNASGRALLLLLPSEVQMAALLQEKKIEARRIAPNRSKVYSIGQKLQSLLSQRPELKLLAQRAFVNYVRSVQLQADKRVFDAKALPLQLLAESMGLLSVPRLKLSGPADGLGKNKSGETNWARGSSGEGDDEGDDEGNDEGDDEGDEKGDEGADGAGAEAGREDEDEDDDDEDEDGELVLRPKTRKGTPRDRLVRLLERSKADRRSGGSSGSGASGKKPAPAAAAGAGDVDLFTVKRRILPDDDGAAEAAGEGAAAGGIDVPPRKQKLKIRKGGTVAGGGTRTVFDDEGLPVENSLVGFEGIAAEKASLPQQPEDRVAAVRATLQAAKTADRERERARVRDLHKSQKRKRKQEEGDEAAEAPQLTTATLGEEDEAEGAPKHAPRRRKASAVETLAAAGPDSLQNDEDRAQAMLAKLLG